MIESKRLRWTGHAACMRRRGILAGKPGGKRVLGRPIRRWEGNIKIDLRGLGWGGTD
jgi:hypothetical protein